MWIFWYLLNFFIASIIRTMSTNNQGSGNIDYSFNKKKYYEIIYSNISIFKSYYIIVTLISFWYLTGLSVKQYKSFDNNGKLQANNKYKLQFEKMCFNSPFNIISIGTDLKTNLFKASDYFIGLSQKSYLILICSYIFAFMILVEYLVKNLMASIIVNYVQENKNNNPYNNPNCITKINESPNYYINKNYSMISSLSLCFLVPYLIPVILKFMNLDKYDIKKSSILKYIILIGLLSPVILIIITRIVAYFTTDIFDTINRFIDRKDINYIDFLKRMFNLKFIILFTSLFILLCFLMLHWIYGSYNVLVSEKWKNWLYGFIIIFVLFVVPSILVSNALSSLYNIYKKMDIQDNLEQIEKEGVFSLYQLIVKYNYPCLKK